MKNNTYLILFVFFIVLAIYPLLNQPINHVHSLLTSIDLSIPFIPIFVIPYIIFTPIYFVAIFLTTIRTKRLELATAGIATYIVSYVIYFFFQTHVQREIIDGSDIFSRLVGWVYSIDRPYNDFPSLHTASAASLATYFFSIHHRSALGWFILFIVVALSTLFIKQHYVLDVLAGAGLGWLFTKFSLKYFEFITGDK